MESSEKQLADYLFMMQDYANALSVYRTAVKDYLNDKSALHYASSSEMAGMCAYVSDPAKKDLEAFFDNAYLTYTKGRQN